MNDKIRNPETVTRLAEVPAAEKYPAVLYWFWHADGKKPAEEGRPLFGADERYKSELKSVLKDDTFQMIFPTARENVNFYDYDTWRPYLSWCVEEAHRAGKKFGIQLWENRAAVTPERFRQNKDIAMGFAMDVTGRLDAAGGVTVPAEMYGLRFSTEDTPEQLNEILGCEVLRAYVFRPAGPACYDPATLRSVTGRVTVTRKEGTRTAVLSLPPLGGDAAGYSFYAVLNIYFRTPNWFSPEGRGTLLEALEPENYGSIPFDGAAIDEFRTAVMIAPQVDRYLGGSWTLRYYSQSMEKIYGTMFPGESLLESFFDMRYAAPGGESRKIAAINRYWKTAVLATRLAEEEFFAKAKAVFGPDCFVGFHNTYHNALQCDELYATGAQWWQIPRDFGFTDENMIFPVRLGITAAKKYPLTYDMYYTRNPEEQYDKAIDELPFGSRTLYHALNDTHWGYDFLTAEGGSVPAKLHRIGQKVRLLNWFGAPLPKTDLLIVYGAPRLTNWYLGGTQSRYNLNDVRPDRADAKNIWDAGYLCALIPSSEIDEGRVSLGGDGTIRYGSAAYRGLIWLYPEFMEENCVAFLRRYLALGGKLLVNGQISYDFSGRRIDPEFRAQIDACQSGGPFDSAAVIAKIGTVLGLEPDNLSDVKQTNDLTPGPRTSRCVMTDGSVVWSDRESMKDDQKEARFRIEIGGRVFTGEYSGVVALRADPQSGTVQKFACGGFRSLSRDGAVLYSVPQRCDLELELGADGRYSAVQIG